MMKQEQTPPATQETPAKRPSRRRWRWLRRMLRSLLGLFLLSILFVLLLLNSTAFQNWAVNQTTRFLSDRLQTTVSLQRIDLDIYRRLILEDLYIQDINGDTLLYSKEVKAGFDNPLFTLLGKRLDLSTVTLQDARIYLRRDTSMFKNNLGLLLERLIPADTSYRAPAPPEKSSFLLSMEELHLHRVELQEWNQAKGNKLNIGVEDGELVFEKIDLAEKDIRCRKLYLKGLSVKVAEREGQVSVEEFYRRQQELIPKPEVVELEPYIIADSLYIPFKLTAHRFRIEDGYFQFDSYRRAPQRVIPIDQLDFDHMRVFDIQFDVDTFRMTDLDFQGRINNLSFQDSSGFVVEKIAAEDAHVNSTRAHLYGLDLVTPYSRLGDTLVFTYEEYPAFNDFENRVSMEGSFLDSYVALRDIMTFAIPLEDNAFFSKNRNEQIQLQGTVSGTVNRLSSDNLILRLGESTYLNSSFNIRDVTDPDLTFFFFDVNTFYSNIPTLRQLLPNFDPAPNFDQMGRLTFSGNAAGFYYDFAALGNLNTAVGRAVMDMQLNTEEDKEGATYHGNLSLIDFDLGKLSGDPNLGKITFSSSLENGRGLTLESAYADLRATVENFTLRGYRYENIDLNGQLNRDFFKGFFSIQDDNINLDFQGNIENLSSVPRFDLDLQVDEFDLYALNLSRQPLAISGKFDIDLLGRELSKLYGRAQIADLQLSSDVDTFRVASVEATSELSADSIQQFELNSDIGGIYASGHFDLALLPSIILRQLNRNHKAWYRKLGLPEQDSVYIPTDLSFDVDIESTRNLTQVLKIPIDTLSGTRVEGYFSNLSENDSVYLSLSVPRLLVSNLALTDLQLTVSGHDSSLQIRSIAVEEVHLGKNIHYGLNLTGELVENRFDFRFGGNDLGNILKNLRLEGSTTVYGDTLELRFEDSGLALFDQGWELEPGNLLRIGPDFIETQDLIFTNEERQVAFRSIRRRGAEVRFSNFSFKIIDDLWDYEPLDFFGEFTATLRVQDIFDLSGLQFALGADPLLINTDNWGAFTLKAQAANLQSPISAFITIGDPSQEQQLTVEGSYNPPSVPSTEYRPNFFDFDVTIDNYPLRYAEYFIGELISDTEGQFNAELRFHGPPTLPSIEGQVRVSDAALTVNYLQTRYTIAPHTVQVDNYLFNATGVTIRDELGNTAVGQGGIVHDHLRDFGLDVRLLSDKFLCMDTRKGDNSLFYGKAIGNIDVAFKGPFDRMDLNIYGQSLRGTNIKIPFSSTKETGELSFIRFVDEKADSLSRIEEMAQAKGLNIYLNLDATEDAEISLIFDEKSGDIIRGRGNGNLRMEVTRTGDFFMYGDYTISEGEYLFTLYDLVNKPFRVKPGGWISWSGDPYEAQINIDAKYSGLSTSLSNFLAGVLETAPQEVRREASQPTDVDVILHLKGELLQPDISFDIEFPQLIGDLRSYAESRLNALERDPNEMNYQVFGLIVTNSFLPEQSDALLTRQYATGINTVSELLANQLSRYLTELVSEVFTDVSFISGVDFDLAYNYFENTDLGNIENSYIGNEFQFNSSLRLIEDKVVLRLGGNYSQTRSEGLANNEFFTYDVVLELVLTQDRRYKLRFYHRTEPEFAGGLQSRTGIGLVYRREFDSFNELVTGLRAAEKAITFK